MTEAPLIFSFKENKLSTYGLKTNFSLEDNRVVGLALRINKKAIAAIRIYRMMHCRVWTGAISGIGFSTGVAFPAIDIIEIKLAYEDFILIHGNPEVDMGYMTGIPTGGNGHEFNHSIVVTHLSATKKAFFICGRHLVPPCLKANIKLFHKSCESSSGYPL
jgi:hypothetical protein